MFAVIVLHGVYWYNGDCFVVTDSDASDGAVLPCTSQQATKLGEVVASEVGHRMIDPFVASK